MKNTRKTTKRILAMVLALITALSAMSALSFTASEASEDITYNGSFDLWGFANQNVLIKINGTNGSTDFHNIGDIGNYTKPYFSFTDRNVGEIRSITIKQEMPACIFDGPVNQFLYLNEWAFKSVTINGVKIYGGQYIEDLNEHTFSVTDHVYKVTIKTADVKNAGTDLNVNVTLNGENGKKSKTINMSEDGLDTTPTGIYLNAFERGNQQTTLIRVPFDTLKSITIELNGGMIAAKGWKCESITIEQVQGDSDTHLRTVSVNKWFATEKDNYKQTIDIPAV